MKVDEDPFLKMGINVAKLNLQSTNDRSRGVAGKLFKRRSIREIEFRRC